MKAKVTIKRYKNKKYYSVTHNKYLTIPQITQLIKDDSIELSITDHNGEDITNATLKSAVNKLELPNEVMVDLITQYDK